MLDNIAIERAYRQHGHSVLRRARQILVSEEEAQEVMHEIFTSLVARPDQYSGRSSLLTWLYSATTHSCLNRLRDQRTRARLSEENADRLAPAERSATAEDRALVRELLSQVPEDLAQVAVYYYFDELTHQEIATFLHCSRRHVGDLLTRFHAAAHGAEAPQ